jgi:hypothetical protein
MAEFAICHYENARSDCAYKKMLFYSSVLFLGIGRAKGKDYVFVVCSGIILV